MTAPSMQTWIATRREALRVEQAHAQQILTEAQRQVQAMTALLERLAGAVQMLDECQELARLT